MILFIYAHQTFSTGSTSNCYIYCYSDIFPKTSNATLVLNAHYTQPLNTYILPVHNTLYLQIENRTTASTQFLAYAYRRIGTNS